MNCCAQNDFQGQTLYNTQMMLQALQTLRNFDILNKLSRIMLDRVLRRQVCVIHSQFHKL
jgi:hypothetical protein